MNSKLTESSFKYCENIAKKHYENFPVASLLLPSDKRKHLYAVYVFARTADDYADESNGGITREKRIELIDEWNDKLKDCYDGKADNPVFIALQDTIGKFDIPIVLFEKLLTAFKQDVNKNKYNTFDELLFYSDNSANPVGRIVLLIFGCKDDKLFNYSDKICTALQLTNFWQDIEIDLMKDRIYLPSEDMKRFGYSYEDLKGKITDGNFRQLIKLETERTRKLFEEGKPLLNEITKYNNLKNLRRELKLTWLGGNEILNKIINNNYEIFNKRSKLKKTDFVKLLMKAF